MLCFVALFIIPQSKSQGKLTVLGVLNISPFEEPLELLKGRLTSPEAVAQETKEALNQA